MHFAHANGYAPLVYTDLLEALQQDFDVHAFGSRPMWPESDPHAIKDWVPLANDLIEQLSAITPTGWIGVGHSLGATTTLMAALRAPTLFSRVIIIDPPLFPPLMSYLFSLVTFLGQEYKLHPLAPGALRRRRSFPSLDEMFTNYRKKRVFRRLSDETLRRYVDSLAKPSENGSAQLRYSPEWEARIYVTGTLQDRHTWRKLSALQPPAMLIVAEHTNTVRPRTIQLFRKKLPQARIVTIPNSSHLVPLEKPIDIATEIRSFLQVQNTTQE